MTQKYRVIYCDPPWKFRTWSQKGTGRSAVSHYKVMTLFAIVDYMQKMIERHAAPDCAVNMWCPGEMLDQGLQVFKACGLRYVKPNFVWAKTTKHGKWHISTGFHTRNNPEFCLLGVRGSPTRISKSVRQLQIFPVRQHSEKPGEFRDLLEQLYVGPYLELFARHTKPGWKAIGDQVGLLDRGPVKTRRQPSDLRKEHAQARHTNTPENQRNTRHLRTRTAQRGMRRN